MTTGSWLFLANDHTTRWLVMAGSGTAGRMAAAAMARTMGNTALVTLVDPDSVGTVDFGESTIPPLVTSNRLLGIGEADFM